ncbi:unnamed protein product [Anisakis simplex]|uniref:Mitochondrial nucleoid factor 1 n=1 Tax=Anisakis simplex TaxID=6269 RepID=A0A0M3K5X5_ANISI|nr:unnamed protein product [Anisakis simplex]
MSSHLYKRFVRLAAKWPHDKYKSADRDLAVFMSDEIERVFRVERDQLPPDATLCLKQILMNTHRLNYPHSYKSGVFGLNLQRLREANSEEGRKTLGLLKQRKSLVDLFFKPK